MLGTLRWLSKPDREEERRRKASGKTQCAAKRPGIVAVVAVVQVKVRLVRYLRSTSR